MKKASKRTYSKTPRPAPLTPFLLICQKKASMGHDWWVAPEYYFVPARNYEEAWNKVHSFFPSSPLGFKRFELHNPSIFMALPDGPCLPL